MDHSKQDRLKGWRHSFFRGPKIVYFNLGRWPKRSHRKITGHLIKTALGTVVELRCKTT